MACRQCCVEEFRPSNFGLNHHQPYRFVTAQWPKLPRVVYLVYRWLVAIYITAWIVLSGVIPYSWYTTEANRVKWFIYLTNWTYFVLTIDVLVQAMLVTCAFIGKWDVHGGEKEFAKMEWYLKASWVIHNLASCVAIVVGITFWLVLFPYMPDPLHIVDFHTHGVTIIYVLVNVFITAIPLRIYHIFHSILYSVVYLVFTVIYHSASGTNALDKPYVYSVLDWSDPGTAAMYSAIVGVAAVLAVWMLLYGCYRLRYGIYIRLYGSNEARKDSQEMIEK